MADVHSEAPATTAAAPPPSTAPPAALDSGNCAAAAADADAAAVQSTPAATPPPATADALPTTTAAVPMKAELLFANAATPTAVDVQPPTVVQPPPPSVVQPSVTSPVKSEPVKGEPTVAPTREANDPSLCPPSAPQVKPEPTSSLAEPAAVPSPVQRTAVKSAPTGAAPNDGVPPSPPKTPVDPRGVPPSVKKQRLSQQLAAAATPGTDVPPSIAPPAADQQPPTNGIDPQLPSQQQSSSPHTQEQQPPPPPPPPAAPERAPMLSQPVTQPPPASAGAGQQGGIGGPGGAAAAANDSGMVDGPPPRNLPKTCKFRPKNARVFVGNLASEFTTPNEMVHIFYKYGELIEEPVLRRSFGFIQYAHPESAQRAVVGEQGRIIGGIPIDLSIADNREVKKGTHVVNNTPFPHGPKKGGRPMAHAAPGGMASRKRRRSQSPPRRMGGVHPPQFRRNRPEPRNGIHMRILCMSGTARNYARQCEMMFRAETQLGCDVQQIVAAGLGDALGKCMTHQIPYVLVVASKDVDDGTCTIRTLERTGYEKSGRGNGVISLREAIDVCLIDRGIPLGRGGAGHPGNAPHPPPGYGPQQPVQMVQAGWSRGGAQMAPSKPGWMSGPRAPPHPQQPPHVRGAGAPQGYGAPPPPPQAPYQQQMARPYDMPEYQQAANPAAIGWQQQAYAPQQGYAQPQAAYPGAPAQPYPQQPMMGAGRGAGRDEYDPTAVMPAQRPEGNAYAAWGQQYQRPPNNAQAPARGANGAAPVQGGAPAPYAQQYAAPGAAGYAAQRYAPAPGPGGNTYMGYEYGQQYAAQAQQGAYQGGGAQAPPQAGGASAGAGKGDVANVDIGKLSNLISAFTQQQRPPATSGAETRDARQPMLSAPSMQQQQQQRGGGGAYRQPPGPPHGQHPQQYGHPGAHQQYPQHQQHYAQGGQPPQPQRYYSR